MGNEIELKKYGSLLGPSHGPAPPAVRPNVQGGIVQVNSYEPPQHAPMNRTGNPPPPAPRRGIFHSDDVLPQKWFVGMVLEYDLEMPDDGPQPIDWDDDCDCEICNERAEKGEEPYHVVRHYELHCHPGSYRVRFCDAYPTEVEAEVALRSWLSRNKPEVQFDGGRRSDVVTDRDLHQLLILVDEVCLWGEAAVREVIDRNRWKIGG